MKAKNSRDLLSGRDRRSALRNKTTGRGKAIKKDIRRLMRLRPRRSHLPGGGETERNARDEEEEPPGHARGTSSREFEDSSSRDDRFLRGEVAATREKNGYISDGWIQTIVRPLPLGQKTMRHKSRTAAGRRGDRSIHSDTRSMN